MKKLLTSLLLFGTVITALAQDVQKFTLKGIAYDSVSNEAATYATVLLLDQDQELIASSYTNGKGAFKLNAPTGTYTLQLNMVGYAPYSTEINLTKDIDLGTITISESISIEAATVVGQLITSDLDKTSYNTEFDPEAKALTALEMMRKVPMLSVDGEETIRLRGETNFKILVNGKSSSLLNGNYKDVLRSMPASSIKRIEVITSPPAKYDAEGIGGIINIITNRKTIEGFNGSVWSQLDSRGGWNVGTYLAGTVGKFNFSGNIYVGQYKQPESILSASLTNFNSTSYYQQMYESISNRDGDYQGVGLEMSYEFDSKNLLSLSINGTLGGGNHYDNSTYHFLNQDGLLTNSYSNVSNGFSSWGGIGASLDYQRTFDRTDQLFTASYKVDYNPNNSNFENSITPSDLSSIPQSINRGENSAWGLEHAFQVDYFDPINENHQIEVGLKYTLRPNVSNSINEIFLDEQWIENLDQKNDLDYMQHIASAYGAYQFKFGDFAFKAGARAEYTINDGEYISQVNTPMFNRYFNIVPYLNFGYMIDRFQNLKIAYTQRITRPGIWLLNPYVDSENPLQITTGNPELDPELTHSVELSYGIYKPTFNFGASISGRLTDNAIEDVITIREAVNISRPENIGLERSLSASINTGARFFDNKLSFTLNGSTTYKDITANDGTGRANSGWEGNVFAMISAELWKGSNLSINGGWGLSGVSLQGEGGEYYFSGVSLSQKFFEDKLSVTIRSNNPLNKYSYFNMSSYDPTSFISNVNVKYIMQNIGFSLSWRFGSVKGYVKKTKRSIESDDLVGGGSADQMGPQ